MANAWFRLYAEFATDPKVQMLSEAAQRRYLMLLCLRCGNGDVTLQDEEIAFQLRISNDDWAETKAQLQAKGLIDGSARPTAWDKRQYVSDSSATRVAAHRARKKQQAKPACNVTVTPPDTDTDTEEAITPIAPKGDSAQRKSPKFDPLTARPANVSAEAWASWCQHRKEIRKPLTATTCKQQATLLGDHPTPDAVIHLSIASGWTGLFPEKTTHASSSQHRPAGRPSAVDQVRGAIAARAAADAQAATGPARQALAENDRDVRPPLDGEFRRVG